MIKPENALKLISKRVKNYERKELDTVAQVNRDLI